MITLVGKQDLWWASRNQVRDHYTNSEYNRIVQSIEHKLGAANFIHEYCSASLVMDNFVSGTNEPLVLTTGGYDQRLKSTNFNAFLKTIEALCKVSLAEQP